ncbi:MAG: aldo/keto reductase [Chthonomonadales bacterium]
MRTRTLGKTGSRVSELGLGGLFVSSVGGSYDQSRSAIRRALELGVNYIDTAPTYADSESVIGRALEGYGGPLILSTKLGGRPQPFDARNRDHLFASVEESLRLLKRDHVDILFIHEPDRPGQYDWWSDPVNYTGPVCDVLDELKEQGVIRFTGLGGTTAYLMARIVRTGRFDVLLTAFNYSLLWREAEIEVLPAAMEQGMGIVIGSPLQQGALARRYDDEVARGAPWLSLPRRKQLLELYALLDDTGLSITEMALRFVLSNDAVACTLMGARSATEVERNVEAAEKGPLPPEILARLDEIAAQVPFRPFDEPAGLPLGRPYAGPGMMH